MQPPPPPGGYGPPPPGYGHPPAGPQTDGHAIAALVCAIGSFFVCPVVLAVVALVLARAASRNIALSGGWREGTGLVVAARVIAWVNIVAVLTTVVLFLLVVAAIGN